jgi:malonyl-CoA O-methyltransferase
MGVSVVKMAAKATASIERGERLCHGDRMSEMAEVRDIDKRQVARRFGRSAERYDSVTPVQRQMHDQLLADTQERLNGVLPRRILELGCGTGLLTEALLSIWPSASVVAVDIAPEMVARARQRCPGATCVTADAEVFVAEQAAGGFDLVISNAAFQWFAWPRQTVAACAGLLRPGGCLALSTFGPLTFMELRSAFEAAYALSAVPARPHVIPQVPVTEWSAWLPGADVQARRLQVTSHDVWTLLRSIRQAGAARSTGGPAALPPRVARKMAEIYHQQFPSASGGVVATYETVHCYWSANPS